MFWILRRTGAVNFFNSINSYSAKGNAVNNNIYNEPGKSNFRQHFRYGRLSVDSDDQNYNNTKRHDDVHGSLLVNSKYPCEESTRIDKNGNSHVCSNDEECDNLNNNCNDSGIEKDEKTKSAEQKTVTRLQALAMSDDEDYDESLCCNVCDRAFHCSRQLASHQQKKRHFGCGGCDTLFPSLMLLEHHKEEYEHWSDSEEYQRPCCRRNRRDDFDYTDSDTCTSDAESEDLERLL